MQICLLSVTWHDGRQRKIVQDVLFADHRVAAPGGNSRLAMARLHCMHLQLHAAGAWNLSLIGLLSSSSMGGLIEPALSAQSDNNSGRQP